MKDWILSRRFDFIRRNYINGILHPRRAALACFLGVRTGIPTIGIRKTLFCEVGSSEEDAATRAVHESLIAADAHVQSMDHPKDEDCSVILVDNCKRSAAVMKSAPNTDTEPARTVFDERTKTDKNDRTIDRGTLFRQLGPFCQGVAIPSCPRRQPTGWQTSQTRMCSGRIRWKNTRWKR
jgi:hypothetical protein